MPPQDTDEHQPGFSRPGSRAVIPIVFTTILIDFVGFSVLIPVLPEYADMLGASGFQVALMLAIYALSQMLFLPAWGWFSDRFGRRPVILVSLAGTVASFVMLALASNLSMIYISRILGGFFAASVGTAQAVITDVTPPEERADGMGKIGASLGVALVLGPAFGGILAGFDMAVPFYAVAIIAALNFAVAVIYLPETRPADDTWPNRRELLTSLVPTPIRMIAMVHDRRIGLYLYLWFHVYVAFAAVEGCFPLYLLRRYSANSLDVGVLFAWLGVFVAVSQGVVVGRLGRFMSEGAMVVLGLVLTAFGLFAIPFSPSYAWLYAIGPVVAFGNGIAFPAFTSLYTKACEARDAGELLGQGNSMAVAGRVVGALIAGLLMDYFGLSTPFVISALVMAVGGVIFVGSWGTLVPGAPPRAEPVPGEQQGA